MCEACKPGKSTRQTFKKSGYIAHGVLDFVHADVWRPTKEPSFAGNRYFVTFIDDYSRKVWLYCIKKKVCFMCL